MTQHEEPICVTHDLTRNEQGPEPSGPGWGISSGFFHPGLEPLQETAPPTCSFFSGFFSQQERQLREVTHALVMSLCFGARQT